MLGKGKHTCHTKLGTKHSLDIVGDTRVCPVETCRTTLTETNKAILGQKANINIKIR